MNNQITHYLITMFNLRLSWDGKTKKFDEEKLKKRFDIFEKYTLPSIQNQSNKNFKWLVLFSNNTPKFYKDKINYYKKNNIFFVPIFIEDENANMFRKIICDYIKKEITSQKLIITTRCDNDDALHKEFINEIQNKAKKANSNLIISFANGYQYDTKTNIIRKYFFPNNHFTSLVSKSTNKTIYDFLHMDIFNENKVDIIKTKPMWIEVTHDDNVYNCMGSIHMKDYIRKINLYDQFNVKIEVNHTYLYILYKYIYFVLRKLWLKRKRK